MNSHSTAHCLESVDSQAVVIDDLAAEKTIVETFQRLQLMFLRR